jgi:hypothetical protein
MNIQCAGDDDGREQIGMTMGERSGATAVGRWTPKNWRDAKTNSAKDETGWADCQRQRSHEKLPSRKSWSFLDGCTTT